MTKSAGIYCIVNITNQKRYIGSAINVERRIKSHLRHLKAKTHHSIKLQNAWNKYGADNFLFYPLLICERSKLLFYEQICINAWESASVGYNIVPLAGNHLGAKRSKQSCARLGNGMRGKKHTAETKRKISIAAQGRFCKWLVGNQINLGKKHSPETRAKISAALRGKPTIGRPQTQEVRDKISGAMKGNQNRRPKPATPTP